MRNELVALSLCLIANPACAHTRGRAKPVDDDRRIDQEELAARFFARAESARARGDSSRAEQYALLAMQEGYPERGALPLLLRTCIEASHFRAARDHAAAYLRRHPAASELRYLLATLDVALDETSAAIGELRRIVAEHPDASYARDLLDALASAQPQSSEPSPSEGSAP